MFFPLVKATFDEENKINVAYKEIGPNFGKRAREGHETGKGRKKMGNEEKGGGNRQGEVNYEGEEWERNGRQKLRFKEVRKGK